MGEDRTVCVEKKNTADGIACRHRHSSVISSCSEDAESESTSAGYPPSPVEEREEELEYGPGIVNKLRTRFLTISLKQNRGSNIRRSCSMENLLDQDRPEPAFPEENTLQGVSHGSNLKINQTWGHLKRAKSMDTLLMEMQCCGTSSGGHSGEDKKGPKIIKRRDGGLNRLCDEELPKPDTVKTYKRMFEPAESRRGSHCRRPPVLRASAKSCAAAKQNGISTTPSAKVNGVSPKHRNSAKPSAPTKSQIPPADTSSPIINGCFKKATANGESSRPLYNGCHIVKASPAKVTTTNGTRSPKDMEKNLNSINRLLRKKEVHFSPKTDIITNGIATQSEILKIKPREEIVKQFSKSITHNVPANGKPKVPPNRPSLKPPKSLSKFEDSKSCENISTSKLKTNIVNGLKKSFEIENQSAQSKDLNINGVTSTENCGKTVVHSINGIKSSVAKPLDKIKTPLEVEKVKSDSIGPPLQENRMSDKIEYTPETITTPTRVDDKISKFSLDSITIGNNKQQEMDTPKSPERTMQLDSKIPQKSLKPIAPIPVKKTGNLKLDALSPPLKESPKISKLEVSELEIKRDVKPAKKLQSSPGQSTSMVFDFRGKDVVSHVAVVPTPFGCKPSHPKKRPPVFVDGKEVPSSNGTTSDDEDEEFVDYSVPPPSGVVFEGENVKIGRGSILSKRNKELKIKFDVDDDSNTFVYPSENSLLEDSDLSPDSPPGAAPNEQHLSSASSTMSNKLKSNTTIGTSNVGGLSTYTPSVLRTVDNFEPGMFRPSPHPSEDEKPYRNSSAPAQEEVENKATGDGGASGEGGEEMLKPADPELISSWSISAGTSDLLF